MSEQASAHMLNAAERIDRQARDCLMRLSRKQSGLESLIWAAAAAFFRYRFEAENQVLFRFCRGEAFVEIPCSDLQTATFKDLLNDLLTRLRHAPQLPRVSAAPDPHFAHPIYICDLRQTALPAADGAVILACDQNRLYIRCDSMQYDKRSAGVYLKQLMKCLPLLTASSDAPFDALDGLTSDERAFLTEGVQGQRVSRGPDHFTAAFFRAAEQHAERIAVKGQNTALTYRELRRYSEALAAALRNRQDLGCPERLAVLCSESEWTVVGILAAAFLSVCYVPIDQSTPPERCKIILKHSGARCLLLSKALPEALQDAVRSAQVICIDVADVLAAAQGGGASDSRSDGAFDSGSDGACDSGAEAPAADPERYLVFTSGTTGEPKGAVVRDSQLMNLCLWYNDCFHINETSAVMLLNHFGFDAAMKNIYAPLLCGAALVMGPERLYDTGEIARLIQACGVTHANMVPALFYGLLDTVRSSRYQALSGVQWVILGGDRLDPLPIRPWAKLDRCRAQFGNVYGPTECTSVSVAWSGTKQDILTLDPVPIGRPICNKYAYICNARGELLPDGMKGTLYLAGTGTINGYLDPGRDRQLFGPDPYHPGLMYNTGDQVYRDADGQLQFVGRLDFQIKLNGQRIELGEIESAIRHLDGVRGAVCFKIDDRQLTAFYTSETGRPVGDAAQLIGQLGLALPSACIPGQFRHMTEFPLNQNGKVDRQALQALLMANPDLPAPDTEPLRAGDAVSDPAVRILERQLQTAWQKTLGGGPYPIAARFFEQGGTSLKLYKLKQEIFSATGRAVDLTDLLEYASIQALAGHLSGRAHDPAEGPGFAAPVRRRRHLN